MKYALISMTAIAVLVASAWTNEAAAKHCRTARNMDEYALTEAYPWHGAYFDTGWGMPVSVVVPPTAENQWHYSWGVGGDRVTSITHQFRRDYPGPGVYNRACFRPTPRWPSSTDQLGDYYIRGPW
jgi:hypothetical protein